MRGARGDQWPTRLRPAFAGLVAGAICLAISACGGSSGGQFTDEPSGKYPVKVVSASFPPKQRLAFQTYLRLGVRNTGQQTIPGLVVTLSILGRAGQDADNPFSSIDPQPGLANHSRPVWVLEEGWPRLASATTTAGAETSSAKTYNFGPLKPGATKDMVWKVAPVKAGNFTVGYRVDAGLTGSATAVTDSGGVPGGAFPVVISSVPEQTRINAAGKIVPITKKKPQVHGVVVTQNQNAPASGN